MCALEKEKHGFAEGSINLSKGLLDRELLASLRLPSSIKGNGNAYFMKIKVT